MEEACSRMASERGELAAHGGHAATNACSGSAMATHIWRLRLGNDNRDSPFVLPQDDGTDHGLLMGDLYDYIVKMAFPRLVFPSWNEL